MSSKNMKKEKIGKEMHFFNNRHFGINEKRVCKGKNPTEYQKDPEKKEKKEGNEITTSASQEFKINKDVRQRCVLYPLLFNIYAQKQFKALDIATKGIKLNDEIINNIRYADDTVVHVKITEEF